MEAEAVTTAVEHAGVHWGLFAAGVAALAATVLNLVHLRTGGSPAHEEEGHHRPPPGPEIPHAAHSMHDVHSSVVDEGLGAILGQGAPVLDPPPRAEYDDVEHQEQLTEEELAERRAREAEEAPTGEVYDAPPDNVEAEDDTLDIS